MRLLKSRGLGEGRKKLKAWEFHPYNEADWIGLTPLECAQSVIGKSLSARKSDQQFNLFGTAVSVLLIFGVISGWIYLVSGGSRKGLTQEEYWDTKVAEKQPTRYMFDTNTPNMPDVKNTATVQPTYTFVPTYTYYPTLEGESYEVFYYSIYNPNVLAEGDIKDGVCVNQEGQWCHTMNCWDFDIMAGKCRSRMATGLDFNDYFGKSVACGNEYPLYTVFEVIYPMEIAGSYTCLDRCPACNGTRLLDFLDMVWRLPAQFEIKVKVILQ